MLLCASSLWGQDTSTKQPLSEVLEVMQNRYNQNFNYFEDSIANISVVPPSPELSLERALDYLRKETGLVFTQLQDNFISIRAAEGISICGYLLDIDTQEPLVSATVQGSKDGTVSDTNGYFELSVNSEEETIIIRFLGYKSVRRQAKYFKTNGCNPIYLLKQQLSLSQVVLSNYLVEGINKLNSGELEVDFQYSPGLDRSRCSANRSGISRNSECK
jgi:hypothetical protein